jgi:YVTN family beta-propeller protein
MGDTIIVFTGVGGVVDSIPPSVTITDPAENDTLYGFEYIVASVSDNIAIRKVKFYVNDSLIEEDRSFPYYCMLDVRSLQEGEIYSINATAEDYSANIGYSDSVDVFIGYYPAFPYVIIDTLYVEKTPYRMDVSQDNTKLFILQNHKSNQPVIDDLLMFDIQTNTLERAIHFYSGAAFYIDVFGINKVYFTSGYSFSVYDVLLNEIVETVNLGATLTGIARADNEKLYIACNPEQFIIVYSLQTSTILDTIPVSGYPTFLAADTLHDELYVCLYSENMISVIDTEGDTVKTQISLTGKPWEVEFSYDYSRAYVSILDMSTIGVIETSSHTLQDEISVSGLSNPKGIALTNNDNYLFITGMSNKVFVVNTSDYSTEWDFTVGLTPYSLGYSALYNRIYVSCLDNQYYSRIFCIGE